MRRSNQILSALFSRRERESQTRFRWRIAFAAMCLTGLSVIILGTLILTETPRAVTVKVIDLRNQQPVIGARVFVADHLGGQNPIQRFIYRPQLVSTDASGTAVVNRPSRILTGDAMRRFQVAIVPPKGSRFVTCEGRLMTDDTVVMYIQKDSDRVVSQ